MIKLQTKIKENIIIILVIAAISGCNQGGSGGNSTSKDRTPIYTPPSPQYPNYDTPSPPPTPNHTPPSSPKYSSTEVNNECTKIISLETSVQSLSTEMNNVKEIIYSITADYQKLRLYLVLRPLKEKDLSESDKTRIIQEIKDLDVQKKNIEALLLPIADTLSAFNLAMKFYFFKNIEYCKSEDNKFKLFELTLMNNEQIKKSVLDTNTRIQGMLNYTNNLPKEEDKNKILNGINNEGHGLLKLSENSQELVPAIQNLKIKEVKP
jgi:hypothetical protein